jgi:peptide deformylase
MKQTIVKIGRPVLRVKTKSVSHREAVSSKVKNFVGAMVKTMRHAHGVGLAANQVGDPRRILVMECRGNARYPNRPSFPLQTYFNARIVWSSKQKVQDWEGCLSIPGYRGKVARAHSLVFEALTPEGTKVRRTLKGFEARVLQHEVDHLDGKFYVDRMKSSGDLYHLEEFEKELGIKVPREKKR